MKDEWSGYLSRVSSGSLIYAMDPDFVGSGYSQEDALHAIGNILNANDFDSIPLVEKYVNNPTILRIARRGWRNESENVVLVELDNVGLVPSHTSLLGAMIELFQNPEHIVLIGESKERARAVLTIGMLAENRALIDYLCNVIGRVSHQMILDPSRDFSPMIIWRRIYEYANSLMDVEWPSEHDSDEPGQLISDLLEIMQKREDQWANDPDCDLEDVDDYDVEVMPHNFDKLQIKHLARWPMAGVSIQSSEMCSGGSSDALYILAAKMLCVANNFTNAILGYGDESQVIRISSVKVRSMSTVEIKEHDDGLMISPDETIDSVILNVARDGYAITKRGKADQKGLDFGIISMKELGSDVAKGYITKRMVRFEVDMRNQLKKMGFQQITLRKFSNQGKKKKKGQKKKKMHGHRTGKQNKADKKTVDKATFSDLMNAAEPDSWRAIWPNALKERASKFRNDMLHEVFAIDGRAVSSNGIKMLFHSIQRFEKWKQKKG